MTCTVVNGDYTPCQLDYDVIVYQDFEFESTIATEFNLICQQQYKVRSLLTDQGGCFWHQAKKSLF